MPTQTAQLNVSGGGFYERPGDDGTAIPWSGSTFLDVGAYLSQAGINGVATAISLRFDNTLQTAADNFSNAFIKKKGVDITIVPGPGPDGDPEIPEPTTALLLIIGTVAAGTMRRAC